MVDAAAIKAGSITTLRDNYIWAALFNRDTGFYSWKNTKPVWKFEDGQWVRYRRRLRRREWIETFMRIQAKSGSIIPLKLNNEQRQVECMILRMERAGLPVRITQAKARQVGMCFHPDTRVLLASLEWVRIADVRPGQEIVAVDEDPPGGSGKARKMRTGIVEAVAEVFEPAYRITLSGGEALTMTGGHRMLCLHRSQGNMIWRRAETMRVGDEIRFVTKPWGAATVEDGWFGGILDGEGSFSSRKGSPSVCASQLHGPVWDRMEGYLRDRGYNYCVEGDSAERPSKFGKRPVPKLVVGRMNELFRLMGQTRPTRFVGKRWWEGRCLPGSKTGVTTERIVSIETLPAQRMIDLQTSTKTFIAEGFVSHNSTFIEAVAYYEMMTGTQTKVLLVGDNKERAQMLLEIANVARMNMPKAIDASGEQQPWKFKMRSKATYTLAWDEPMLSHIRIASAEEPEPGQGGTRKVVHLSETASHSYTQDKIANILPSLPTLPGTYGFNESTPNGGSGWFYEIFMASWRERDLPLYERKQPWIAMFFPSWGHHAYRWTMTYGYGRAMPQEMREEILRTLTADEEWVMRQTYLRRWREDDEWEMGPRGWKRVGVGVQRPDLDHIAWRRSRATDADFRGDTDLFNQEYAKDPETMFMSSGRPVYDRAILAEMLSKATDPWRGDIELPEPDARTWEWSA